jgi:ATP-dependent helicase/nuclease subunit A
MEFTEEQKRARDLEGSDILVSAGAGSGKTTVLTARVLRKIEEGKDLNRLLILTFTINASASMKNKIRKALKKEADKNAYAKNALTYLDSADIMTIDAFNHKLVERYFYLLGIQKSFTIVNDSLLDNRIDELIDQEMERKYEEGNPLFLHLLDHYTTKNDEPIRSALKNIIQIEETRLFPEKDLLNLLAEARTGEKRMLSQLGKAYDIIGEKAKEYCQTFVNAFDRCADDDEAYGDIKRQVKASFSDLSGLKTLEQAVNYMQAVKDARFRKKKTEGESAFKDIYEKAKKGLYDGVAGLYKKTVRREEAVPLLLDQIPFAVTILEMCVEIEMNLMAYKKSKNVYGFSDIASFALELLNDHEDIRAEVASSYDEIMVDEYQDNNDIQEQFISLIKEDPSFKGHLFMVGDVKQSIYAFRHANPTYFMKRYQDYKKGNGGTLISLNENFRSTPTVIKDINAIFSNLMADGFGGADYKNGHQIIAKHPDLQNIEMPTRVFVYGSQEDPSASPDLKTEAKIIADDILTRIRQKELIGPQQKPVSFKDFCLLADRGTQFDTVAKVFKDMHIPLKVEKNQNIKDQTIIWEVRNLFLLFDSVQKNERESAQFLHALLSLERGPLGQRKDEEISAMFVKRDFSSSAILRKMTEAVQACQGKDILAVYDDLLARFAVYASLKDMPDPSQSYQFLFSYRDIVKGMAQLSYTPSQAAQYFQNLKDDDKEVTLTIATSFTDAVTLTNIHKSKGLEYPIIYYIGLSKLYNEADSKDRFAFQPDLGLFLPFTAEDFRNHRSGGETFAGEVPANPFKTARDIEERRQDREEKVRLLYVDLTRAQYQMIFLERASSDKNPLIEANCTSLKDLLDYSKFLGAFKTYGPSPALEQQPYQPDLLAAQSSEAVYSYFTLGPIAYQSAEARASKSQIRADKETLDYGTKAHLAMQGLDLKSEDASFIEDPELRKMAEAFLASSLRNQYRGYEDYHEYHFIDPETGAEGSIDLLLVGQDDLAIVDYKLSEISDEAYRKQLEVYKANAERIFGKKARCYLYSLKTAESEQIC